MAKMNQAGVDRGDRGETGEKFPKRANSEDERGEKHNKVPKADSERGTKGQSGEELPKSAKSRDESGERSRKMAGGVGMGEMDDIKGRDPGHMGKNDGRTGEFNSGSKEHECYDHKRWA